jgi:hypothetical protein
VFEIKRYVGLRSKPTTEGGRSNLFFERLVADPYLQPTFFHLARIAVASSDKTKKKPSIWKAFKKPRGLIMNKAL